MHIKKYANSLIVIVNALAVNFGITCHAAAETNIQTTSAHQKPDSTTKLDDAELTLQDGLFVLDYQDIQLPDNEEIDLLGFHILKPVNEWLYLGVGGYAPVSKGEYGGFMAFDVLLHAQRKVSGNLFVNGGLSLAAVVAVRVLVKACNCREPVGSRGAISGLVMNSRISRPG